MIEKLAILAIDKADGTLEITSGEKGYILSVARAVCKTYLGTTGHGIARLRVFSALGTHKDKKFREEIQRLQSEPVAPIVADDPDTEDADESVPTVKAIRELLKEKGVQLPPRIGIERLRALAAEHGIEA